MPVIGSDGDYRERLQPAPWVRLRCAGSQTVVREQANRHLAANPQLTAKLRSSAAQRQKPTRWNSALLPRDDSGWCRLSLGSWFERSVLVGGEGSVWRAISQDPARDLGCEPVQGK